MTDHDAITTRLSRARSGLRSGVADALVCFPSSNMYYLSGFEDEPMERHLFLIVTPDDALFLAPEMYDEQIREESPIADVRTWGDDEDPIALLASIGEELELAAGRLLVDDRMWAMFTQDLREVFPEATFGLASELLTDLRIRKDDSELDRLERAASIADSVSELIRTLGSDAIGMTERELAVEIERRLEDAGGDGISFDVVVGSGPNGARPHHRHGARAIEPGDPVVLDFGTRFGGYPSDQTRTVVFGGNPPTEFESAFDAVLAAQKAGIQAIEPGVEASEVDRAAREVIEKRGYGDQFIHRTGHGVGLDVHEPPYITGENDRKLEEGMVFSVEPGVYIEGAFGIRIEDLVVVTGDGCKRLNRSPRTWKPLGEE
ncbi:Xaa-Pro aminopeptidase [Halalkaliarchaeum sp. AArc-CO]|uniref:M24 family metallopeptidase n=1 Tax=unclassified Halalkaliarchaeum TaxID=2678344 RepID=UPI00217D7A48|nr:MULTISPECIES: Xaa-Pro peptidase family protein [unclassified Halalkaliarchaeum]MDR5673816.1 Xaa-Pro peptidase family protein [Halalkaliarchaeum sp. AArc-GB]UWG50972.1 Xaa-Pro aminopeptidase [Halalkaliarchaeum sp. AArc-CO]